MKIRDSKSPLINKNSSSNISLKKNINLIEKKNEPKKASPSPSRSNQEISKSKTNLKKVIDKQINKQNIQNFSTNKDFSQISYDQKKRIKVTEKKGKVFKDIRKVIAGQKASDKKLITSQKSELLPKRQIKKICINDFQLLQKISNGDYWSQFSAINIETGFIVNLRAIQKRSVKQIDCIEEVTLSVKCKMWLSRRSNICINNLYGIFEDNFHLYLVEEPTNSFNKNQKTLEDVCRNKKFFVESQITLHLRGLLQVIRLLHSQEVIYRQFNMKSIINSFGQLKLTLFDNCAKLKHNTTRHSFFGQLDESPQQLILGKGYNKSYDIWSIGIVLFEMATGRKPFLGDNIAQKLRLCQVSFPMSISNELGDLLSKTLTEMDQRIEIDQVINHPFFKKNELMNSSMILKDIWVFWLN